jgi:hypothetical protein
MNKPMTLEELQASSASNTLLDRLLQPKPILPRMSQKEKLYRWAELCYQYKRPLMLFHNLEHCHIGVLQTTKVMGLETAMSLAAADPVFNREGLRTTASIADVMYFFELTQQQLHEFSCDCGGQLENWDQANRIVRIAESVR